MPRNPPIRMSIGAIALLREVVEREGLQSASDAVFWMHDQSLKKIVKDAVHEALDEHT